MLNDVRIESEKRLLSYILFGSDSVDLASYDRHQIRRVLQQASKASDLDDPEPLKRFREINIYLTGNEHIREASPRSSKTDGHGLVNTRAKKTKPQLSKFQPAGALCAGDDKTGMFFPKSYKEEVDDGLLAVNAAASFCIRCPQADNCLRFAILHTQQQGIWGGVYFNSNSSSGNSRDELEAIRQPDLTIKQKRNWLRKIIAEEVYLDEIPLEELVNVDELKRIREARKQKVARQFADSLVILASVMGFPAGAGANDR